MIRIDKIPEKSFGYGMSANSEFNKGGMYMKRKNRKWYYVSYYESYPVFESAEGGYYYEGVELQNFERFGSLKSARRFLRKKIEECGGKSEFDYIGKYEARKSESSRIGDSWCMRIETVCGKYQRGWKSYC